MSTQSQPKPLRNQAMRSPEMMREAFNGHKNHAHGGRYSENCPACKELAQSLNRILEVNA